MFKIIKAAFLGAITLAFTTTAYADFTDPEYTSVTITARYALIYNTSATLTTNAACFFLDFTENKTATNGTFKIVFPTPGASGLLTVTG